MKANPVTVLITLLATTFLMTACSNNKYGKANEPYQRATVMAIKDVSVITRSPFPLSHVGVSVGSGGHRGIYGSFGWPFWGDRYEDIDHLHEIIIKTAKGEYLTVRQDRLYKFKKGDTVKLVKRWNRNHVIPFKAAITSPKSENKTVKKTS